MSIAVFYRLQHAQLQALVRQKQARKRLREVKLRHSARIPFQILLGERHGISSARDTHRRRDHLVAPVPSQDKAGNVSF
jgi:hypothetical protein